MALTAAKSHQLAQVPAYRYVTTPLLGTATSSFVDCHDPSGGRGLIPPCAGSAFDVRRKNASRESTETLKSWLIEHRKNPYPTKADKIMLAIITRMTLTQVSTWFANARRRLKKENKNGEWGLKEAADVDDDCDTEDLPAVSCDSGEAKYPMRCVRLQSTVDDKSDSTEIQTVVSSTTTSSKHKLWSVEDMVASSTDISDYCRQRESFTDAYKEYLYNMTGVSLRSSTIEH